MFIMLHIMYVSVYKSFKILNYNFPESPWSTESKALMKDTKVKVSILENLKEKKKIEINTLNIDELDF